MSDTDRISVAIPADIVQQIKDYYIQANLLLVEYLINLTPEERMQLPKMGDRSFSFVMKGVELLEIPGTPTPPYINVPALGIDMAAFSTLYQIQQIMKPTMDMLDDTLLLCGSESYVAILALYNYLKGAAKMNVPGAKTAYEELSARFAARPAKKVVVVVVE